MLDVSVQNLDNWKSSRRKRQEHIIERVVEVKKLELEEHDRQRRRSKTFSEMMEERGRKMSISLAMYQEEDANDLSDLGIGTSSGKSSVSGDTHDDAHSVLVSVLSLYLCRGCGYRRVLVLGDLLFTNWRCFYLIRLKLIGMARVCVCLVGKQQYFI